MKRQSNKAIRMICGEIMKLAWTLNDLPERLSIWGCIRYRVFRVTLLVCLSGYRVRLHHWNLLTVWLGHRRILRIRTANSYWNIRVSDRNIPLLSDIRDLLVDYEAEETQRIQDEADIQDSYVTSLLG